MFGKGQKVDIKIFEDNIERDVRDWLANEAAETNILDIKFATVSGESGSYRLFAMVIFTTQE